jgi:hypothetical protein
VSDGTTGTNGTKDVVSGKEVSAEGDGDGLRAIPTGGAVTRIFMATNTPVAPAATTITTGTRSITRSKSDFLRDLILRVCGTWARAASGP